MQNAGMAALKLNWRYLAFDVHPDHLRAAISGAQAMGFVGLNLTVPHKLLAVDLADVLDETARTWGAVNTIRFEGQDVDGLWKPVATFAEAPPQKLRTQGFNTDADAVTRSIREDLGIEIRGAKIILLGAGGAGRTAALKLAAEGAAELFLVNRTQAKVTGLIGEIAGRFPHVNARAGYPPPVQTVDLIVNATSLGLKSDDAPPFDATQYSLAKAGAAYDMIYRPAETAWLRTAKAAGCRTANGIGMLLHQGAKALELWSGLNPPIEVMREALTQNIYGR